MCLLTRLCGLYTDAWTGKAFGELHLDMARFTAPILAP
jgi:hypothetical protein